MTQKYKSSIKIDSVEFIKYFFASILALAVDYGCYWILTFNRILNLPQAAVVGYSVGLAVAYFLIADRVFQGGWLKNKKNYEALLFITSGLLGIALTYITVALFVLSFGQRAHQSKLAATAVSFICVYMFRKKFVFKRGKL